MKNKLRIWPFGGVDEIGGTKLLLDWNNGDTRLFLDFGKSYSIERKYSQFPSPTLTFDELLSIRAIPPPDTTSLNFKTLYSKLVNPKDMGSLKTVDYLATPKDIDDPEPPVDGIIISHAHTDHYQYISLLNRNIPIYIGECGLNILKMRMWLERKTITSNFFHFDYHTFKTSQKLKFGDIEVMPIHVDHSIPGAYGFLIYTPEGTIVYTGDFRFHGHKPSLSQHFLDVILNSGEVDILISEGTHISESGFSTEEEVKEKSKTVINKVEKLVIADFSNTDFDRFRTFYDVAKSTGRKLVLTQKQALILSAMNLCNDLESPNIMTDEDILILTNLEKKKFEMWEKLFLNFMGVDTKSKVRETSFTTGFNAMLDRLKKPLSDKIITNDELKQTPEKYIFAPSFNTTNDLRKIHPPSGSLYLLSTSEPFNEEREIQFDKLLNWLTLFGMPMIKIHVSGHANPLDLQTFITSIRPKKLVPIHTENSKLFENLFAPLGIPVEVPKYATPIEL